MKQTPGPWIASKLAKAEALNAEMLEALRALLIEHAEMNADLRKIGRGRNEDGSHPDCPADMARAVIEKARGK
jgi:hypothetical protein